MNPGELKVPENWTVATVGEIIPFSYGKALTATNRRGGAIPVYSSAGCVGMHDEALVPTQCLVVGRKGTIGRVELTDGPCWVIDTAFYATVPSDLDPQFLLYALRAARLDQMDQSAAIPSLSRERLHAVLIPIPPRAEQSRIVEVVERAMSDVARGEAQLREAATLSSSYRRALYEAALSGQLSGDEDELAGAQLLPLGDLTERITSGSRDWKRYYGRGSGVFVMAQNVRPMRLDFSETFHVDPPPADPARVRSAIRQGDVLLTIVGAGTGTVASVKDDLPDHWVCQSVALIRPKRSLTGRFLELWMNSPTHGRAFLDERMYGQGRPHLGFADLKVMPIPVLDEDVQNRIVDTFERHATVLDRLHDGLNTADRLAAGMRRALIAAACAGRLSPQDARDEPAVELLARISHERRRSTMAAKKPVRKTKVA